ncbi:cytochrome b5 [Thozetella sp. PMI_491]|nr:cytochrome b5 [Thozetella sp. PMI_491]
MADSVRQRKGKAPKADEAPASSGDESPAVQELPPRPSAKKRIEAEEMDTLTIVLDVLRVLSFLFVASCGLSYLISGGETFFWGMSNPPKYLQTEWWKAQLVAQRGPVYFTLDELAAYDGKDETKPLYLAINGTVYDVSANRRTYGPGGSYHWFAGTDASRAYVTGCFAEDRTADMRGAEEMYLPIDDPAVDKHWSAADMTKLKEQELAEAKKRVHDGLKHWVDFFAKSKKYQFVGYVKRPKGWPNNEPKRKLCDAAAQGRAKRQIPQ